MPMSRAGKAASWFAVVLTVIGTAYVYFILTRISQADIVVHDQFDLRPTAVLRGAGEIVAVSPDGMRMESICQFAFSDDEIREASRRVTYVNSLKWVLPDFSDMLRLLGLAESFGFSARPDAPMPDRIDFVGRIEEVNQGLINRRIAASSEDAGSCACEIAERVRNREKVCAVVSILIEDHSDNAFAARLARDSLFPRNEAAFRDCGMEPPAPSLNLGAQRCAGTVRLDWDVDLRARLRLIERIEAAASAPDERG